MRMRRWKQRLLVLIIDGYIHCVLVLVLNLMQRISHRVLEEGRVRQLL